jgi:FkbM family methyltransferase
MTNGLATNRFWILLRRAFRAAQHRVLFVGITRFTLPRAVRVADKRVELTSPPEPGLACDFVNVWLDDEYGLEQLACSPKTIVDIGGNIGLFSLWALRQFPQATLHAYEPNRRAADYYEKNLQQFDNATLFHDAVGSITGNCNLIEEQSGESRMVRTVPCLTGEIATIAFSEVADRIGGTIDLLKLDCEGAEWDIFSNPKPFERVRAIRMEYHFFEGQTIETLRATAQQIGHTIVKLVENDGFGVAWMQRQDANPTRV